MEPQQNLFYIIEIHLSIPFFKNEVKMKDNIFIAVSGGTGSGKTTVVRSLLKKFPQKIAVLYQDNYYKENDSIPPEKRALLNYDCPEAFDTELFIKHISDLKHGKKVLCPKYDFTAHNRSKEKISVIPQKVIIAEGILVLSDKRIRDLADVKIFIDCDADVRLLRRIRRDTKFRGRSLESVASQYLATVKPMHEKHIEPAKKYADIIINNGGKNKPALDMLCKYVESLL